MRYIFIILILLKSSFFTYGQERKDSLIDIRNIKNSENKFPQTRQIKEKNIEIIILKNKKIIEAINAIDIGKQCVRKDEYWYVDYTKKEYIILSKSRIQNKIQLLNSNQDLFFTIIDNHVFFVYGKNLNEFTKTGLKVDISHLINLPPIFIEHSSYWLLKEKGDEVIIIFKRKYNCD